MPGNERKKETEEKEEKYRDLVIKIFIEGKATCGANRICGIMRKRAIKPAFIR